MQIAKITSYISEMIVSPLAALLLSIIANQIVNNRSSELVKPTGIVSISAARAINFTSARCAYSYPSRRSTVRNSFRSRLMAAVTADRRKKDIPIKWIRRQEVSLPSSRNLSSSCETARLNTACSPYYANTYSRRYRCLIIDEKQPAMSCLSATSVTAIAHLRRISSAVKSARRLSQPAWKSSTSPVP